MQINITCDIYCRLNCKFCYSHNKNIKRNIYSVNQFKKILNKVKKVGYDEITLTPNTGDSFDIPNIYEIANFLENDNEIKTWSISTNLVPLNKIQWDEVLSWKKCALEISLYGFDKTSYDVLTDTNEYFNDFKLKIYEVLSYIKNNKFNKFYCLDFLLRCNINENQFYKDILNVINNSNIFWVDDSISNFEWNSQIKKYNSNNKICFNSLYEITIMPNGDVFKCIWCINKLPIFNIFKNELTEIFNKNGNYHQSIKDTKQCENCSDFKKISNEPEIFNNIAYKFNWLNFLRTENNIINLNKAERCL